MLEQHGGCCWQLRKRGRKITPDGGGGQQVYNGLSRVCRKSNDNGRVDALLGVVVYEHVASA